MILTSRSSTSSTQRSGFGLPEIAIATILLAVALAMVGQGVVWVANARRGADRKQRALQEAANMMERIAARPWTDLTPEFAKSVTLDPTSAELLNQGRIEVRITPVTDGPPAKKIAITVISHDVSGNPQTPIRLAAWVYRREGIKP